MSNRAAIVIVLIVGLVAVIIFQAQRLSSQKTELIAIKDEQARVRRELADAQALESRIAKQSSQLRHRLSAFSARAQSPKSGTTNSAIDEQTESLARALAQSMNDPEHRKIARENRLQKVEQQYAQLIEQLHLSADDAQKLKDLIADNQTKLDDKMLPLIFTGGNSTNNLAAMAQIASAEQTQGDQRVKELVGDAAFAQYQEYQKSLSDRDALHQFEIENPNNALAPETREQLIAIMRHEEQQTSAASGLPVQALSDIDITDWPAVQKALESYPNISESQLGDLVAQAQKELDQRIYERAKTILNTEQLSAFGAFQRNRINAAGP